MNLKAGSFEEFAENARLISIYLGCCECSGHNHISSEHHYCDKHASLKQNDRKDKSSIEEFAEAQQALIDSISAELVKLLHFIDRVLQKLTSAHRRTQ